MMYKYEHGGDIYTEKLTKDGRPFVDYSANINPLWPAAWYKAGRSTGFKALYQLS